MSLGDALDSGLLVVEFDDSVELGEPEIVQKTYAIHAVVDQRKKKKVGIYLFLGGFGGLYQGVPL